MILAAGASRRMGTQKLLLPWGGRPLLQHVLDTAAATSPTRLVLVLGSDHAEVRAAISTPANTRVVVNPHFADGQATSLAAGLSALEGTHGVVVLLGDQPEVAERAITRVGDALARAEGEIVRARYDDAPGHPVGLAPGIWPRAIGLRGDTGARALMATARVTEVEVEGRAPPDIDTAAAYRDLCARRAPE